MAHLFPRRYGEIELFEDRRGVLVVPQRHVREGDGAGVWPGRLQFFVCKKISVFFFKLMFFFLLELSFFFRIDSLQGENLFVARWNTSKNYVS